MPAALPSSTLISQAVAGKTTFAVAKAQFGNGYSERVPLGLNSKQDSWDVRWDNIDLSTFTSIITALDAALGCDYFTWTAPGDGASKKWIVPSYTRGATSGGVYSLSASLEQVYDL